MQIKRQRVGQHIVLPDSFYSISVCFLPRQSVWRSIFRDFRLARVSGGAFFVIFVSPECLAGHFSWFLSRQSVWRGIFRDFCLARVSGGVFFVIFVSPECLAEGRPVLGTAADYRLEMRKYSCSYCWATLI